MKFEKIKKVLENLLSITELILLYETVSQSQPYLLFIFVFLFVKLNIVASDIFGIFQKDWQSFLIDI